MKKSIFSLIAVFLVGAYSSHALSFANSENRTEKETFELNAKEVIAKYIQAVGGQANIDKIRNAYMQAEAEFQGIKIEMLSISDAENVRMKQQTSVMGNVQQKTILLDGKCTMTVMGQVQPIPEEMLSTISLQAYMFPETKYEELGIELELRGIEDVDGEEAYAIVLNLPNGMKTMEYYSVSSSLKIKTSSDAAGDITYSDYQETDGVLVPRTMVIQSPMIPFPLETKFVSVEFNKDLTLEDFK